MSLVGKQFPNITVKATQEGVDKIEINLSLPNKPTLLFWYPKDFTYICPTEIHAFQDNLKEFEERGYQVIGASCDTCEVHEAWLDTPKEQGGIQGVTFPLLADSRRSLANKLGILDYETEYFWNESKDDDDEKLIKDGDNVTYRATYLIDETGRIFHESVNDMPLGRNVHDYLRIIDTKVHQDKTGDSCPANWEKGDKTIKATKKDVAEYLSNN